MKRLLYAVILCFLTILPANTRAQDSSQSSDAPYLYYFSSDIDAVVIERADGTDTRVLGAELFENITTQSRIERHGWSPSGKWFSWVVGGIGGEEVLSVVSVDGKRELPFAAHYSLIDMAWSPVEDVLLMWGNAADTSDGWPYGRKTETFLMAYDFSANKYLFKFDDLQQTFSDLDPVYSMYDLDISWSSSGEHIFIDNEGNGYHIRDFVVISRYGQFLHSVKDVDAVPIDTAIRFPNARSATKIVFFAQEKGLIIADLLTREHLVLDGINNKPKLFVFSPDQSRAIIVESGLWLWSEDGLSHLLGERDFIYSHYQPEEAPYWSSDNRYALINGITEGRNSAQWIIDTEQQQVQPITNAANEIQGWHYPNWYWINTHQVLLPGSVGPTQTGEYGFEVRQFSLVVDVSSLETERIDFGTARSNPAAFNNGLSILATIYDGPVIHNRNTGETLYLRPHPDSYPSYPGGVIKFDSSSEWILSKEEGYWSGGGASHIGYTGVTRVDGTHRRDLTNLYRFAEWLPAQVNVADLPAPLTFPILPEPQQVINTPNWITHISWSPDQHYLVTIHNLTYYSSEAYYVWDFSQETLSLGGKFEVDPIKYYAHYIDWQIDENHHFSPVLDTLDSSLPWYDSQILAISKDESLVLVETQRAGYLIYSLNLYKKISDVDCRPPVFPRLGDSFSPDNKLLACSAGIHRVTTGEKLADIPVNGTAFAFSPDGTQLAVAASWDVLIYDVAELLEWKSAKYNFARHNQ